MVEYGGMDAQQATLFDRQRYRGMLPQQYPTFPRPSAPSVSAFQFTHRYLPTGSVGGDFFTVSALTETKAGVFLCDVARPMGPRSRTQRSSYRRQEEGGST